MLKKTIILPIGSYEAHGAGLPPETDALIAQKIGEGVNQKIDDSKLLPPLSYGMSLEHKGFEETMYVKASEYFHFLYSLVDSIAVKDALIILVNGHGGNNHIAGVIESEFNYQNDDRKIFAPSLFPEEIKNYCVDLFGEFDSHAGSVESSLMSYYGAIDEKDRIEDSTYIKKFTGSLRFHRTIELTKKAVIKNTESLITDSKLGKKLHDRIIETIIRDTEKLRKDINLVNKENGK